MFSVCINVRLVPKAEIVSPPKKAPMSAPSCRGNNHGLPPCSPAPGQRLEQAGTGFAAGGTASAEIKVPCRDGVPVAADQPRPTAMTIGALARLIMHVPGIDVAEPRL